MDRKKTTQFRTTEMSIQEEGLASLFISQKDQGKKEKKVPFWMKRALRKQEEAIRKQA